MGRMMNDEGYTSHENFQTGKDILLSLRENGLNTMAEEDRVEFEKQTRWVLDIQQ